MDELIKLAASKAGIPADKAKIAVETVIKFIKDKLPAPIAAQVDGILAGGDISKTLGGLMGK